MEEGGLIGADLDERGLDPRQDRLDAAQVDVADDPARVGPLHQELDEDVVLEYRHARFLRRGRNKNFSLHTSWSHLPPKASSKIWRAMTRRWISFVPSPI